MGKKITLVLLLLTLVLSLAGCAKVNGDNSFQNGAVGGVTVTQNGQATQGDQTQQANPQQNAEPTATPTQDPNAPGFNG